MVGGVFAANAATGDPFDPGVPKVFIVQGAGGQSGMGTNQQQTTLNEVVVNPATGEWEFADPKLLDADLLVNGIGWNATDGYVYGVIFAQGAGVTHFPEIVKIGQGGSVERTGKFVRSWGGWAGDIDSATNTYYLSEGNSNQPLAIRVIDLSLSVDDHNAVENDPARQKTIPLTGPQVGNDWVFKDGFLWSVYQTNLVRTDPATGVSVNVAAGLPTPGGHNGAIWLLGNGNIGVSNNASGDIFQIALSGDLAGQPKVDVVSQTSGPANMYNDGAAVPGRPADLTLTKTGPDRFMVGDKVVYEFTVKNTGQTPSSGWSINDLLPLGLSNPMLKDSDGASMRAVTEGNRTRVFITGGLLEPGAERTIRLEVDTADSLGAYGDLGADRCFVNSADLWGNEQDPRPEDNSAKTQCVVPYDSRIELKKSVSEIIDVNGNGITDAGDQITWKFEVKNTGKSPLTGVNVVDQLLRDSGIAISGGTVDLGAGETTTFLSEKYTITKQDAAVGEVKNVAVAKGHSDSGVPTDPESNESNTVTPVEPTPSPVSNVNASASASASAKSTADVDPEETQAAKAAAEAAAKPDSETAADAAADVSAKAAAKAAADPDASTAASADASSDPSAAAQVSARVSADGTQESAQDAQASVRANADASSAAKAAASSKSSADASVDFQAKADADAAADPKANVNASASASASAKSTADVDPEETQAAKAAAEAAAKPDSGAKSATEEKHLAVTGGTGSGGLLLLGALLVLGGFGLAMAKRRRRDESVDA
ncbi:DUF6923 family protein [Leucobacter sp. HNU]|uniref:DUF6923 family protein n=1 Tax=Leucobacter sp. HNU TaxID=3236805 RepID=UPI003A7FE0EB